MMTRAAVFRLFLSTLLAMVFVFSLLDTFDREKVFPVFTTQVFCSAVDDGISLEKKKKSPFMGQIFFILKIDRVQETLFIFKESWLSLPLIFSCFLRAPPLV